MVTQTTDSSTLLNSLLGSTAGMSNFVVSTNASALAYGTFSGGVNPISMSNGIVLSTGSVAQIPGANTISASGNDLSTDLSGSDDVQLTVTFTADTATDLFFNFVFGSEEFLEYSGSIYNDLFELSLNGVNLAKLSNNQNVTINNLTPNSNPANAHPDYINYPAGPGTVMKLDGFIRVLGFTGALNVGMTNTLVIRIADVGDSAWDSAVFIKGLGSTSVSSVVPEPASIVSLALGLVCCAAGCFRRRKAAASAV